jgi:hypothetical protein
MITTALSGTTKLDCAKSGNLLPMPRLDLFWGHPKGTRATFFVIKVMGACSFTDGENSTSLMLNMQNIWVNNV